MLRKTEQGIEIGDNLGNDIEQNECFLTNMHRDDIVTIIVVSKIET